MKPVIWMRTRERCDELQYLSYLVAVGFGLDPRRRGLGGWLRWAFWNGASPLSEEPDRCYFRPTAAGEEAEPDAVEAFCRRSGAAAPPARLAEPRSRRLEAHLGLPDGTAEVRQIEGFTVLRASDGRTGDVLGLAEAADDFDRLANLESMAWTLVRLLREGSVGKLRGGPAPAVEARRILSHGLLRDAAGIGSGYAHREVVGATEHGTVAVWCRSRGVVDSLVTVEEHGIHRLSDHEAARLLVPLAVRDAALAHHRAHGVNPLLSELPNVTVDKDSARA